MAYFNGRKIIGFSFPMSFDIAAEFDELHAYAQSIIETNPIDPHLQTSQGRQLKRDFDNVEKIGFQFGYESGYDEGEEDGYTKGYIDGETDTYDIAYEEGYTLGYEEGEEFGYMTGHIDGFYEGEDSQNDYFWDTLQRKGSLKNYAMAFCGLWTPGLFYPKYDMKVSRSDYMFSVFANNYYWNEPLDLVERLNECGVILDTTESTNFNQMFSYAKISHIGVLNCTSANGLPSTFISASALVTIDKIILKDDGSQTFNSAFTGCSGLENIAFEGVIGNSIDFKSCPLSTASIINIIEHLSDSKSATLTLKATSIEAMSFPYTSPETNTTYNSWDELKATKQGWTFTLA